MLVLPTRLQLKQNNSPIIAMDVQLTLALENKH